MSICLGKQGGSRKWKFGEIIGCKCLDLPNAG
jgi:hypothetical protein